MTPQDLRDLVIMMRDLGVTELEDGETRIVLGPAPGPAVPELVTMVRDDGRELYAAAGRTPPDLRKLRNA